MWIDRANYARIRLHYIATKMQGAALFQKKSLNLHMPGRTRPYLRRIPCLRANKGVPKYYKSFQKKSLNLHMPGRMRSYLRRIPCLRANKGVPKIACNNRSNNVR